VHVISLASLLGLRSCSVIIVSIVFVVLPVIKWLHNDRGNLAQGKKYMYVKLIRELLSIILLLFVFTFHENTIYLG
jgi:hypothetical protein